jgi:hypothetical protein
MLVLRDLVGVEPLGGLYRALAGERKARGLLARRGRRTAARLLAHDYLDEEEFWAQVERAQERARASSRGSATATSARPEGRRCPPWCDLWRCAGWRA